MSNIIVTITADPFDKQEKTVFQKLAEMGHAPAHECLSGYCGACATTVVCGKENLKEVNDILGYTGPKKTLPCSVVVERGEVSFEVSGP